MLQSQGLNLTLICINLSLHLSIYLYKHTIDIIKLSELFSSKFPKKPHICSVGFDDLGYSNRDKAEIIMYMYIKYGSQLNSLIILYFFGVAQFIQIQFGGGGNKYKFKN